MFNKKLFLSISTLFFMGTGVFGQILNLELTANTNLMFFDAKKNKFIIINDSIHYNQIDINTGLFQAKPYYRDSFDNFSEFKKGYKIITDKQNQVYFVDIGCGQVYKWQHDSIVRIDRSFHHKNQFNGHVFEHKGSPHIFGGYGFFLNKNLMTAFDLNYKEWFKVSTEGVQVIDPSLNSYATKLRDELNILVFQTSRNEYSTQVYSLDLNHLRWTRLGLLNLKIKFTDLCQNTNTSHFLILKEVIYHLDYQKNKIYKYKYLIPNKQIINILEIKNKILTISLLANDNGHTIMIYNKNDFFKNKVDVRPLIVPERAPIKYSIALLTILLVLLLLYLIIRRKKSSVKTKELKLYEFKKVELELLNFWLTKSDLKIEMNEINDFVGQDSPSIDTLKKRREILLKGLKYGLEFYFKDKFKNEKMVCEGVHPHDSRMKILIFNEHVALILKNNKLGEKV